MISKSIVMCSFKNIYIYIYIYCDVVDFFIRKVIVPRSFCIKFANIWYPYITFSRILYDNIEQQKINIEQHVQLEHLYSHFLSEFLRGGFYNFVKTHFFFLFRKRRV